MGYVFVADDFTGASDTLATLARAGLATRLFLDLPAPADVAGLDAWGIATAARAMGPAAITALAGRLGAGLGAVLGGGAVAAPGWLHLKVCSTFDSSAETGNIARLAQGLADAAGIGALAVIGGQPSLGRYAIFGTLFARAADGAIHRIDRHPVMAHHPVTPMLEADLLRHLAALGLHGLARVARGEAGRGFPRFYDALEPADVRAAGEDLGRHAGALLVMGPSSVAEAWLAARAAMQGQAPVPALLPGKGLRTDGPVLIFGGSRSSLTTAQIAAAGDLARLPVNPADLVAGGAGAEAARAWATARLARGQDCMLCLTADHLGRIDPGALARAAGALVAQLVGGPERLVGGLVVAGGDTASAIVSALNPAWLDYAGEICAGVPILSAQIGGRRLPMALKGGQMGEADFFARAITRLRGATCAAEA